MNDAFDRPITYARLSLTQKCNLRCVYCRPEACPEMDGNSLLSVQDYARIARVLSSLGIRKIRLTGGEPLLRPDLEEIVARIAAIKVIDDVSMTTNGHGLAERASALRAAGLMRVNLSLDSLISERYRQITGGGSIGPVLAAIDACQMNHLVPLKLNVVLVKGVNDDEIASFAELTRDRSLSVRFIELMPMNHYGRSDQHRVSVQTVLEQLPGLQLLEEQDPMGPARYYRLPGHTGTIGLIHPISHQFCASCNRIRITADGMIKPCLGDQGEVSLRDALCQTDDVLTRRLADAIMSKPAGHHFDRTFQTSRSMDRTGG